MRWYLKILFFADRCDPPPRCPKPDRGPPGQCPPKCIYDYATVNGKRCKVGCHLGGKGPLVESGERCPPTMVLQFPCLSVRIVFDFTRVCLNLRLLLCKLRKNELKDFTTF